MSKTFAQALLESSEGQELLEIGPTTGVMGATLGGLGAAVRGRSIGSGIVRGGLAGTFGGVPGVAASPLLAKKKKRAATAKPVAGRA